MRAKLKRLVRSGERPRSGWYVQAFYCGMCRNCDRRAVKIMGGKKFVGGSGYFFAKNRRDITSVDLPRQRCFAIGRRLSDAGFQVKVCFYDLDRLKKRRKIKVCASPPCRTGKRK